jgi:RNA polymerase sigma factor (TIGR02999 family)
MSLNEQIAEHYEALRALAHRLLCRGEGTLRTTALVHEVFLKLRANQGAESEAHLMNLAARTMRQVLVDAARKRTSEKRGGNWQRISLSARVGDDAAQDRAVDVLAIEQSLQKLEIEAPQLAQVVQLHFFGGMSFPDMSRMLGLNERTLFRYWRTARAQMHADLTGAVEPDSA